MTPAWYLRRLTSMSPGEIVGRIEDMARRRWWRVRSPAPASRLGLVERRVPVVPDGLADEVGEGATKALLAEAEDLLAGRWRTFGQERTDVTEDVDYYFDVLNGVRAPDSGYSFDIDHRDEAAVGNIKFVSELARHHHLTVLAAAYALSGDDRFAVRIDRELRNYWRATPFLVGIHWTSGIELGLRLLSWTWIRRLLDRWPGAAGLFEDNPTFVDQLGRHQQWLAAFPSHGSSANNHLIAEACGQFVAASAFGLFDSSDEWRRRSADVLARELKVQTFPDGLNRELASDYHGFVLEMALVAWVEAVLTGQAVADRLAPPIARGLDALHAVVDHAGRPHRQGDADDAHGLLVDPAGYDRWASLRRTASLLAVPAAWWGADAIEGDDVRSALFARCLGHSPRPAPPVADPQRRRPSQFPDAGLTFLRDADRSRVDELWCVIDHGPHGFLSIAAHAHADALAVEIRHGGVEVVTDPGTYCYHGEPEWRSYFRSTVAHATLGLGGVDQSDMGGPFLWTRTATARLVASDGLDDGPAAECTAEHDGYEPLGFTHRRTVRLDRADRSITIADRLVAAGPAGDGSSRPATAATLSFPLGPTVEAMLDTGHAAAELRWPIADDPAATGRATVSLDPQLSWSIVCGQASPPLGWYSAHFGTRRPAPLLIGHTTVAEGGAVYRTSFQFDVPAENGRETRG